MTYSTLFKSRSTRIATLALALAAIAFGWTAIRAVRADPLPSVSPMAIARIDAITHRVPRPTVDLKAAVENDLFSPDRTAPSGSYRLPGETGSSDKPVVDVQRPTVLGTAVATDGRSFATLQLGDSHPTLVHVGDKIGEWVVRAIERGKVTLVNAAGVRADVAVENLKPQAEKVVGGTPEAQSDPAPYGRTYPQAAADAMKAQVRANLRNNRRPMRDTLPETGT